MYLSAVVVPPLAQREEVARVLTAVGARMAAPPADSRRRWRRTSPTPAADGWLTPLPTGSMAVHLTRFGYVDPEAGARLRAALEHDAPSWPTATVRITGHLSTHGSDERLHLTLDGDVDDLRSVFRETVESARRAGFLLDRRSFAPLVPVADLDPGVPDDALAALVTGLEDFAGAPWEAGIVTLARLGFGSGDDNLQAVATIPIGETTG